MATVCQQLPEACGDMQVGSGGLRSLATARAPMTMDEILEVLTNKARLEAEDAQRVLLAALNGLAALMLLEHSQADAVQAYREVGQSLALVGFSLGVSSGADHIGCALSGWPLSVGVLWPSTVALSAVHVTQIPT